MRAAGGLASSLHRILAGSGTTWASVTMGAADREAVAQGRMHEDGLDLLPVVIDDDTYRQAYDVVANTTLWYCHHHLFDLPHRPRFDRHWRAAWEGYRAYNRAMADVVVDAGRPGRRRLRAGLPLLAAGADAGRGAPGPAHGALLAHALRRARHARRAARRRGGRAARRHGRVLGLRLPLPPVGGRLPGRLRGGRAAGAAHVRGAARPRRRRARGGSGARRLAWPPPASLRAEVDGRRIVARTDRMEPSKNIVRGMLAFEELLTAHPEWRGRVVHVALAYPSRQGLAEYLAYAADVEHTAERINHALGTDGWTPILLSVQDDWPRSLAALTLSDVLLVNPVRDGLNLVAKEGPLLNQVDGVLVLSHQAGAWEELSLDGGGAIGVNPFDVAGTADALHAALTMDAPARRARAAALRDAVRGRTAADWWADQVAAASALSARPAAPAASAMSRSTATAPVAPATVRSAASATARRALGVDRRHPHRRAQRPAGRDRSASERGESGQVADVVAEGGRRPQRLAARPSCSATRQRTTVPLSTSSGGRSSRSCRPCTTMRPRAACWRRRSPPPSPACSGARRKCSVTVRPLGST